MGLILDIFLERLLDDEQEEVVELSGAEALRFLGVDEYGGTATGLNPGDRRGYPAFK